MLFTSLQHLFDVIPHVAPWVSQAASFFYFHFRMDLHARPLVSFHKLQILLSFYLFPPVVGFTCASLSPTQLSLLAVNMRYEYLHWLVASAAAVPLQQSDVYPSIQFGSGGKFSIPVFSDLHLGERKIYYQ